MSRRLPLVSQGYDPLIIVSKSDCDYVDKVRDSDKFKNKVYLPYYLNPTRKVKVNNKRTWVLDQLENDEIPYISKKLDIASYIVKNKNTEEVTVVKRMTVQDILDMWSMSRRRTYYQGKTGFKDMMRDLRNSFSNNVKIVFAIEDYYTTFFDNTTNAIWTSWKVLYSDKKDSKDRPKYATLFMTRHSIHPYTFHKTIEDIERMYDIHVEKFSDGIGLYSYLVNELIFSRNVDEERRLYTLDHRIDKLVEAIPFIEREDCPELLDRYGSVYNTISAFLLHDDPTLLPISNIEENIFKKWRRVMTE